MLLFYPYFIRQIDETAAAIDPGIIREIILAVCAILIFKSVTWWIIKTIWSVFAHYSDHSFETNFRSLTAGQKMVIYLGFYLVVMLGFIRVLEVFI